MEHEVYSLFNNIPKAKNTNRFPSKDFISKTLWYHYGDRLFTFVDKAQDDEPNEKLKTQLNFTQIFLNIKDYFDWACQINLVNRVELVQMKYIINFGVSIDLSIIA